MKTIEWEGRGEPGSLHLVFPDTTNPSTWEHISLLLTELALKQMEEGGDPCCHENKTGQMPVPGIHAEAG